MAAKDHSGSSEALMSSTRPKSHDGSSLEGSPLATFCSAWGRGVGATRPSSGPVTESNGLRSRIGLPLVLRSSEAKLPSVGIAVAGSVAGTSPTLAATN
jgi:hypothetical protein